MPSKTPKQKSFMAAVANNPKFAKKVGVASKVGKEFEMKDKKAKPKKFAAGGLTKILPTSKQMGNMNMAKGGSVSARADGIASKGKTSCSMAKMAKGGKMKAC
jgi:hypothetical protein